HHLDLVCTLTQLLTRSPAHFVGPVRYAVGHSDRRRRHGRITLLSRPPAIAVSTGLAERPTRDQEPGSGYCPPLDEASEASVCSARIAHSGKSTVEHVGERAVKTATSLSNRR